MRSKGTSVTDKEMGEQAMSIHATSSPSEQNMRKSGPTNVVPSAAPLTGQHAHEIQAFGSVVAMPLALAEKTRRASAANLNQLLADTITLRDLYKKHHRSEEHTSELQSLTNLVCRLLLEK